MAKYRAEVSKERGVNTYVHMRHASMGMLKKAEEGSRGSYYCWMASLVFAAFTLEAYFNHINHIGQRVFGKKCWEYRERLSPERKLNVIAEKLEVERDDGKRPFQTVAELFKFRNSIAHGKTVLLKSETRTEVVGDGFFDNPDHDLPEAPWEKYCTLENARRAVEDVEGIIRMLHKAAGMEGDPFRSPSTSGVLATSITLLSEEG
jgi:hypothetical protein